MHRTATTRSTIVAANLGMLVAAFSSTRGSPSVNVNTTDATTGVLRGGERASECEPSLQVKSRLLIWLVSGSEFKFKLLHNINNRQPKGSLYIHTYRMCH